MNRYNKYQDLIAPWKTDPKTREGLIQRIRENASKDSVNAQTLFTEETIAQEYYKLWLELPQNATLQKIAQHPLLDKKMREKIDEQLQ